MYIFANRGLGMSPGKLAAQVAHGAVEAFLVSDPGLVAAWRLGGHYTKLVMLAEDTEQLQTIKTYIEARGFETQLIIDEGRTEIKAFSPTALGVEIVDKDDPHVAATFATFKTYREPSPSITIEQMLSRIAVYDDGLLSRHGRRNAATAS